MHKKILVIILASIAVIISGFVYLLRSDQTQKAAEQMIEKTTPSTRTNQSTPSSQVNNMSAGAYVDYSNGVIASTSGTKLLFFHAPWCPQCRALEEDIKQKGVPAGVTIIKVDYDSNQGLRQKYGVTLQTTVVKVDNDGKLVEKFVAYNDPSLSAVSARLLP